MRRFIGVSQRTIQGRKFHQKTKKNNNPLHHQRHNNNKLLEKRTYHNNSNNNNYQQNNNIITYRKIKDYKYDINLVAAIAATATVTIYSIDSNSNNFTSAASTTTTTTTKVATTTTENVVVDDNNVENNNNNNKNTVANVNNNNNNNNNNKEEEDNRIYKITGIKVNKISDIFDVKEDLGQGGYAVVKRGIFKETQKSYALKIMSRRENDPKYVMNEIKIHNSVGKHVNVNKLITWFQTKDAWVMVLEHLNGGELFEQLIAKGEYSEREASETIRKIGNAILHLHSRNIVHGDIKPENIMVNDTEHGTELSIVDFGMAFNETTENTGEIGGGLGTNSNSIDEQDISNGSGSFNNPNYSANYVNNNEIYNGSVKQNDLLVQSKHSNSVDLGTVAYAPKEVLCSEKDNIGKAIDIWALGIVMYILLSGTHPFDPDNDSTDDEIAERIKANDYNFNASIWKGISANAIELIKLLLSHRWEDRPSVVSALAHPWLADDPERISNTKLNKEVAEKLRRYNNGRRFLRATILSVLLGIHDEEQREIEEDIIEVNNHLNMTDYNDQYDSTDYSLSNRITSDKRKKVSKMLESSRDSERFKKKVSKNTTTSNTNNNNSNGNTENSEKTTGSNIARITTNNNNNNNSNEAGDYNTQRKNKMDTAATFIKNNVVKDNNLNLIGQSNTSSGHVHNQYISTLNAIAADDDNDGDIVGEFYSTKDIPDDHVYKRFKLLDAEGDGIITIPTIKKVTKLFGEKLEDDEIQEMIHASAEDSKNAGRNNLKIKGINADDIKNVCSSLRWQQFPVNAVISKQGDLERVFYLLEQGAVEESFISQEGKQIHIDHIKPGEHFGTDELMRTDGVVERRSSTFTCTSPESCRVLTLPQNDLAILTDVFEGIELRFKNKRRKRVKEMLLKYMQNAMPNVIQEKHEKGDIIVTQGDATDDIFLIVNGEVEVVKATDGDDGEGEHESKDMDVRLELLHQGDFFPLGVAGIFRSFSEGNITKRGATVRCVTPVEVVRIEGKPFRDFLNNSSSVLYESVHKELLSRLKSRNIKSNVKDDKDDLYDTEYEDEH